VFFVFGWGLSSPVIESRISPEQKWVWPWARGAPQNFGVPFNISATAEASDFKFGTQLGFATFGMSTQVFLLISCGPPTRIKSQH